MQDHFKHIYVFAIMLVAAAFAISMFVLIHFGERYVEQILTFWLLTGAASGVGAITGISISNMKKPTPPAGSVGDAQTGERKGGENAD